jgi:NACHT domain
MEWSTNSGDQCIFWLSGMAGTGKSTIARTIAGKLDSQKRLGASFFFSRGEGDLANATKFIGALAAQLASMSPVLRRHIANAIAEHSEVVQGSLRNQWERLILWPIKMLKSGDLPVSDLVIVIDALDECGSQDDVKVIIQLLSEAKALKDIRLRTLVTSRPESAIQVNFRSLPPGVHQELALHTIPDTVIHHDISLFLQKELEKIRQDHFLPDDWPGPRNIELLVRKANGLFIYAATACRFIGDANWLPEERLTLVFQEDSAGKSPTRKLDEIYTQVLKYSVIGDCDEREKVKLCLRFRQIVGSIVILFEPLTTTGLAELLHMEPRAHAVALRSLHSILDVSQNANSPVRLLHPSFRDFLLDEERCSDPQFFVEKEEAHKDVTERCLRLLSKKLRRNPCKLHTPGALASELKRSTVEQHFPPAVRYACLYWCDHLQQSKAGLCDDNGPLHKFLQEHLLHWLEAVALLGEMSRGLRMVTDLQTLLRVS